MVMTYRKHVVNGTVKCTCGGTLLDKVGPGLVARPIAAGIDLDPFSVRVTCRRRVQDFGRKVKCNQSWDISFEPST